MLSAVRGTEKDSMIVDSAVREPFHLHFKHQSEALTQTCEKVFAFLDESVERDNST